MPAVGVEKIRSVLNTARTVLEAKVADARPCATTWESLMLTSHTIAKSGPRTEWAKRLEPELNRMVNEQFDSPEFRLLAETPLTLARARFYSVQLVFYATNRRDCWAYVQARAPYDVKQTIWHHEQDELIHDPRGGTDHMTLMSKEALALGVTDADFAAAEPTPLVRAALLSFTHLAANLPWIGALTASHFLERRNNPKIIKGGRPSTVRWRDRLLNELKIEANLLASSNVHAVADEEHSDSIEDALFRHVTHEDSYNDALLGARECQQIDRAFRAALAHGMRAIEG